MSPKLWIIWWSTGATVDCVINCRVRMVSDVSGICRNHSVSESMENEMVSSGGKQAFFNDSMTGSLSVMVESFVIKADNS